MSIFNYRTARPEEISTCLIIRGQTRENAISKVMLSELDITPERWVQSVLVGKLPGVVAESNDQIIGYCFGDADIGEIVVLALLPKFEGLGVGKELLRQVMEVSRRLGHQRLFLGRSSNPAMRSCGFYRHMGWAFTHQTSRCLLWRSAAASCPAIRRRILLFPR